MTDIVTPNTDEWIVNGRASPAFIQFLGQAATWINDRQAALTAAAEEDTTTVASISESGAVPDVTDPFLDTDGDRRAEFTAPFGLMFQGTASNADIQDGGWISMGRIQSIYNRQKLIVDRQEEIVTALIEAGLMENT